MKLRKLIGLLLICVMVITSFSACGNKNAATNGSDKQTDGGTEGENANTDASNGEIVTLKWVAVGNGMPLKYDSFLAKVNPYLEEKIGVNIDMEIVPWGEWDNRRNVIANSGEYFDIMFTDTKRFPSEVKLGVFADITNIIEANAPKLKEEIPQNYWTAVTVEDKVYAVPTMKDSSLSNWWVWDKAIIDKYNVDAANLVEFKDLTDKLLEIKEGEGTPPFYLNRNGVATTMNHVDNMDTGIPMIGVKADDSERKVICLLEDEAFLSDLDTIHEWYKLGIINADAPSVDEAPKTKMLSMAQGWSLAAKTSWGPNMGIEAEAYKFRGTILSNSTIRGSLNGIYSGSKYPEKALEFLQLMNTDTWLRDQFYYGTEGEYFDYTEDGKVVRTDTSWEMAGYTQGNYFIITPMADIEFNQWDEVKELNDAATASVLLGFNLDSSSIETELVNCLAVWEKYRSELLTGAREPREMVVQIIKELNDAGLQTVLTEMQTQIDAEYK